MNSERQGIFNKIKRVRRRKRVKRAKIQPKIIHEESEGQQEVVVEDDEEVDTISDETSSSILSFEHIITDFELKLKYLNLKDTSDAEFGYLFPPIKSKFIVIDDEEREFSVIRAGRNQISGDLYQFFNENGLKPGDTIVIEYDRESFPKDGKRVIYIKIKK